MEYWNLQTELIQLVAGFPKSGVLKHPLRLRVERVDIRVQLRDVLRSCEFGQFANDSPADVLILKVPRHDNIDLTVRMQADVAAQAAAILDVIEVAALVLSSGTSL